MKTGNTAYLKKPQGTLVSVILDFFVWECIVIFDKLYCEKASNRGMNCTRKQINAFKCKIIRIS